MFFVQKWQHELSRYSLDALLKKKKAETLNDAVKALYDGADKISSSYNIVDKTRRNAPTTLQQRLNRIWFTLVFWIFIAPVRYVMTGYTGFDERTPAGQWVARLIGEEFVAKASGYKGGWQKTLSREEFLIVLSENGINTLDGLYDFLFPNDYDDRYAKYYIVESKSQADNASKLQRFNRLWFVPLLFVYVVIARKVYYIIHGDNSDQKYSEKTRSFLAALLGWDKDDIF